MIPRYFLFAAIACLTAACQNKPDSAAPSRNLKEEERLHQAGLILLPDLEHASAWEKLIHVDMGVPKSKIDVLAGAGLTTIIIKDLNNRGDIEGVAQELRSIAEKKSGTFGTTKVEVRLNHAPATINPFLLPSEGSAAPVNPGSVLPTLSLPPFRIDGR